MPRAFAREFRDDVVKVAQRREPRVTIKGIADVLWISEACLQNWLRQADVEAYRRPGMSSSESAELRELCRRKGLLDQENEVLRRTAAYLLQAILLGKGSTRS